MPGVSGNNLCQAPTRQFFAWARIPRGTLLGSKVGYILAHTMIDDETTMKQQSTINREQISLLRVGVFMFNHTTNLNSWGYLRAKIHPDMIYNNLP